MYTVFGYNGECQDFTFKFDNFVEAVKSYRKLIRTNVCFIQRDRPDSCIYVDDVCFSYRVLRSRQGIL